ncbi:hypothetical protein ACTFIY_004889 [Dictyostelium cf. discoideum]
MGLEACQKFSDKTYSLGNFSDITFSYDNIRIRYKAEAIGVNECPQHAYEKEKRVTDFYFKCNKNVQNISVVLASETEQCHYEITMEGEGFCDCDYCAPSHSSCYNGKCKCDQYTTGETCEQLNINISQIISATINGGTGYLIGDFGSIVENYEVLIGGLKCRYTELIDLTKIEIFAPGSGFQSITITDGISSYDSPILFYYKCLNDYSQPHGICDLGISVCRCDTETFGTNCEFLNIKIYSIISTTINGGVGYINGDFQFITPNFNVFIGETLCTDVELENATTIRILVQPDKGFKKVTITDEISSYYSPILFEYMNVLCLYNCSQPHGECNLYSGVCTCDTQTNGTGCEHSRIYIDSIDPTDENGGTTYLYGYFGNTTSNLYIKIGDNYCNNTQQINETLIECDVGVGSGFKDILLQDRDLQVRVEKLFQYFVPTTTNAPKQCLNECGPNQEVNSFTFKEWEFNKINSETCQFKTNFKNLGLNTNVTVTLQWFNKETNFEFGNQIIKMNRSSIKYTIEISEFKFLNKLNQLQLIMKASISVNKTSEICSDKEFGETSNGDDLNYLKVQVDNHSLYGRFIKRALIDPIPRSIENVQIDSSMKIVESASQSQTFIVGAPSNSDNSICSYNDSSYFSKTKISAIVVCGFLGIVTVSTIAIYGYYKKKHYRNLIKELRLKISAKQVDTLM